ncbi:MAG: ROK family transcriptional regulator [Pseudomonadota bacterium]
MQSLALSQTERHLLDVVRRKPGISRSAITAHMLVSQQTVHRMLDGLALRGLVRFTDAVISGRGKPSPGVELVPNARYSVGVSVNTDEVMLSLADLSCAPVVEQRVATDPSSVTQCLSDIRAHFDALLETRAIDPSRVLGIGLSLSGFKSGKPGHFVPPVPLSDWVHRDLREDVSKAFAHPVWLENNATAGAIGEAMVGAGLVHDTFAYLSFNYGFGCGLINRCEALAGGFGNAGEIGRIYRPEELERRPAMGELLKRLRTRGIDCATIGEFIRRYDPSWPGIEDWLDEVTPQLQLAVRGLVAVFDPSAIVFGGEAPVDLRQRLIARCAFPAFDRLGVPVPSPELLNSAMTSDPAAFGAALVPLKATVLI